MVYNCIRKHFSTGPKKMAIKGGNLQFLLSSYSEFQQVNLPFQPVPCNNEAENLKQEWLECFVFWCLCCYFGAALLIEKYSMNQIECVKLTWCRDLANFMFFDNFMFLDYSFYFNIFNDLIVIWILNILFNTI